MRNEMEPKHKSFNYFIGGRFFSLIGTALFELGFIWYLMEQLNMSSRLGLVLGMQAFFGAVTLLFSGQIIDRYPRHLIISICDFAEGIFCGVLFVLAYFEKLTFPIILIYSIFSGIMLSFFSAASEAFVYEIVPEEKLQKANSVLYMMGDIIKLTGPVIAGFAYPWIGFTYFCFINMTASLLATLFDANIKVKYNNAENNDKGEKIYFIKSFIDGIKYIKEIGFLGIIIFLGITNILDSFHVLFPQIIKKQFNLGSEYLGIVNSSFYIGTILSSMILFFLKVKNFFKLICITLILQGLILMVSFLINNVYYFIIDIFAFGVVMQAGNMGCIMLFQTHVEEKYQGRFFSISMFLLQLAIPIGILLFGFLGDYFSNNSIYFYTGVLHVLVAGLFYFVKREKINEKIG